MRRLIYFYSKHERKNDNPNNEFHYVRYVKLHRHHPLSGEAQPPLTFLSEKGKTKELDFEKLLIKSAVSSCPAGFSPSKAVIHENLLNCNTFYPPCADFSFACSASALFVQNIP